MGGRRASWRRGPSPFICSYSGPYPLLEDKKPKGRGTEQGNPSAECRTSGPEDCPAHRTHCSSSLSQSRALAHHKCGTCPPAWPGSLSRTIWSTPTWWHHSKPSKYTSYSGPHLEPQPSPGTANQSLSALETGWGLLVVEALSSCTQPPTSRAPSHTSPIGHNVPSQGACLLVPSWVPVLHPPYSSPDLCWTIPGAMCPKHSPLAMQTTCT